MMDIKKAFKDFNFKYNPIYRAIIIDRCTENIMIEEDNYTKSERAKHKGTEFTPEKPRYNFEEDSIEMKTAYKEWDDFSVNYWRKRDKEKMEGISRGNQRERSLFDRKD